jgi:hypothetical protein
MDRGGRYPMTTEQQPSVPDVQSELQRAIGLMLIENITLRANAAGDQVRLASKDAEIASLRQQLVPIPTNTDKTPPITKE